MKIVYVILFLLILAGVGIYYEYQQVKQIEISYQSVKFVNDSNGRININVAILINNPSNLTIDITDLTSAITVGILKVGTITLPAPVTLNAGSSTTLNLTVAIPTSVISFANLILLVTTNPSINMDTITSANVFGIPIYNMEFIYVTNLSAVL